MKDAITITSSLPPELSVQLSEYAQKLKLPKSKLIELSLRQYLDNLKKAEYIRSFQNAGKDAEMLELAEAGLEDYLKILEQI